MMTIGKRNFMAYAAVEGAQNLSEGMEINVQKA
jgi:hypothetical protein